MKARVIKTGEIIEIITKTGNYFIDSNSSPFKEEELEFSESLAKESLKAKKAEDENPWGKFYPFFTANIDSNITQIAVALIDKDKELSYICEALPCIVKCIKKCQKE